MARRTVKKPHSWIRRFEYMFSTLVVTVAFFMFIPVHTALSAGIASLSLLLFILSTLITIALLHGRSFPSQPHLSLTLVISMLGLLMPQIAYGELARQQGSSLSFNPLTYVTFSGSTDLKPSKVVTYANNKKLAYYRGYGSGKLPVIVLLHGGGWRYGNYLQTGQWPDVLTRAGFSVISVEYSLSDDATPTWQAAPADIHNALIHIRSAGDELAIDTSRITLLGQSAGGHLALLEAYRYNQVRSVIALYAPVDLELDYKTSRDKSAELNFLGGPPSDFPVRYRNTSPLSHVSSLSPPTLVVQGERDDLVAPQNAVMLTRSLSEHSIDHELLLLPMTGHSFENQRGGFATQIAEQRVIRFLQSD